MKIRIALAICFLILTVLGVAQIAGAQQPNVLVVAMASLVPVPTDLNPLKFFVYYYIALTYPDLVGWDKDGKIVPALAETWNISPDGLTYTFTLRDGLKWSDGQPITSDDVAFTLRLYIEQGAYYAYQWSPIETTDDNTVTGYTVRDGAITTPDPKTVIFHLLAPSGPFFIYTAGWPILPKHYYEGMDLLKQNPDLSTMVASGPFIPREFIPGDRMVCDANPNFYAGKPLLDQVIFKFYRDSSAAEVAIQTGEAQYMGDIPATDAATLSRVPGLTVTTEQPQTCVFMVFNLYPKLADGSVNPVANLDVRKAIALSINMPELLDASLGGPKGYRLANQLQVPNMYYGGKSVWNTSIPLPEFPYDLTTAAKLLDAAGYPVGQDDKRFSLTLVMRPGRYGTAGFKMMQLVQSYLKAVNIEVELILLETNTWIQRVYGAPPPKDWNIALNTESQSPDPDIMAWYVVSCFGDRFVEGCGGDNAGGYYNPLVNQLTLLGQNTTDVDARVAIYQRIDGIAHEELPVLMMYYGVEVIAWNNRLQGFVPGLGNPMHDYWGALKDTSLAQVSIVQQTTTTATGAATTSQVAPTDYTAITVVAAIVVVVAAIVAYYIGRRKRAT